VGPFFRGLVSFRRITSQLSFNNYELKEAQNCQVYQLQVRRQDVSESEAKSETESADRKAEIAAATRLEREQLAESLFLAESLQTMTILSG
jgi:hypothetical protein